MQKRDNRIKGKGLEYLKSLIGPEIYRFKLSSLVELPSVFKKVGIIASNGFLSWITMYPGKKIGLPCLTTFPILFFKK